MRVKFLGLDSEGNETTVGAISWNGSFRCEPDTPAMRRILERPIYTIDGPVAANKDPEAFLEALQYQFKSAYLRATAPEA